MSIADSFETCEVGQVFRHINGYLYLKISHEDAGLLYDDYVKQLKECDEEIIANNQTRH